MCLFDWFRRKPATTEEPSATGKQNLQVQPAPPLFEEPAANHPTKPPGVVDTIRLKATAQGARAEPEPPQDEVFQPAPPDPEQIAKATNVGWTMTPSARCFAIIKEFEGCKLKAYRCPAGVWTIGYGWTIGVKPGMRWTQQKAEEMLIEGVKPYAQAVAKSLGRAPTTQGQYDALVSFCYNAGQGNFRRSSMLRYHLRGQRMQAANAFLAWNKGGGKVLKGLVRRRQAERALYLSKL